MTGEKKCRNTGKMLAAVCCLVLAFVMSACVGGNGKDGPRQVPYYIGAVLRAESDDLSKRYKKALDEAFAALETETARFEVDYLYSEEDQLQQEHAVNSFIAQGVDAVFVFPVSAESAPMVHDLILDSGGTYCVLAGVRPEPDALDEKYVFCFYDGSDISSEIRKTVEKLTEVLLPVPEEETE